MMHTVAVHGIGDEHHSRENVDICRLPRLARKLRGSLDTASKTSKKVSLLSLCVSSLVLVPENLSGPDFSPPPSA